MSYRILANGIPFARAATEAEARTVAAKSMLIAGHFRITIEENMGVKNGSR